MYTTIEDLKKKYTSLEGRQVSRASLNFDSMITFGREVRTLEIQIIAIALFTFSCFKRKTVLNGFNKAWYLSIARTIKVKEETETIKDVNSINLQSNFGKKSCSNIEGHRVKMVSTSLTAKFAKR